MNICVLKNIKCLYASEKGFCPFSFDYCADEEYWKKEQKEARHESPSNNNDR